MTTILVCSRCRVTVDESAARATGWQVGYVEEIIAPDDPHPRYSDEYTIRCPDHALPVSPPGSGWRGVLPAIAQLENEGWATYEARERELDFHRPRRGPQP